MITSIYEYKQIINENNNTVSTEPKILLALIKDKYPNIKIDGPFGPVLEIFEIRKTDLDNSFKQLLLKNNWYISRDNNIIEIRPKYSKNIAQINSEYLLHATPTKNVNSILKFGLKSKSNDLRHNYPNRIYLAKKISTIKQLIIEMKRYTGLSEYTILKINMKNVNTTIYKDDTCMYYDCYYIQEYDINKNDISILK